MKLLGIQFSSPVGYLILGVIIGFLVLWNIRSGETGAGPYLSVKKSAQPIAYWVFITVYGAAALVSFWEALAHSAVG